MRHGETDKNVLGLASTCNFDEAVLTATGRAEVKEAAKNLKEKNIQLIFSSPFLRTRQTAEIVATEIGLSKDKIIIDERIKEINTGIFDCKPLDEYRAYFSSYLEKFDKRPPGGETLNEVRQRVMNFLYEIEAKYENKNILIISHGDPLWMIIAGSQGLNRVAAAKIKKPRQEVLKNAGWRKLDFVPLPHNEDYELDLHRPFIDEIELLCDCGGVAKRVPEVLDVWLDSGAMPFAQSHYPFENKEFIDKVGYPADFIAEAIDQTRGWFYTLHAVGTIVGKGKAFRNVICLGHVLDAAGKKMSKSAGNVVEPEQQIAKYGADLLRFFMYVVNQPGESKNYDEKMVAEMAKKPFTLLLNVVKFFETWKTGSEKKVPDTIFHILDRWILARLNQLKKEVTENLENYHIFESARAIRDFIFDLSQWYLRRSRERIKGGSQEALATLSFTLIELAKLLAPFTPFIAEYIFKKQSPEESVHLMSWPNEFDFDPDLLVKMVETRKLVSQALEIRAKAGIKVRQPLSLLTIPIALPAEFLELIKEEVNVKKIIVGQELNLDLTITAELKEEGILRELIRSLQDLRKENNFLPRELIKISIETDEAGFNFLNKFLTEIKNTVLIKEVALTKNNGREIVIEDFKFKILMAK